MAVEIQTLRDIDKHFASRQYDKAISLLEKTIHENPGESSLKLKLADAYFLYGNNGKSVELLQNVAISFARVGFITKAMAVQKKIERIDPSIEIDIYKYIEDQDFGDFAGSDDAPAEKPQTTDQEIVQEQEAQFKALDALFKGLKKEEFSQIFSLLNEHSIPKGELVFKEGDTDNSVYIIFMGRVSIIVDHHGKPVELAQLKEGDFFGEVALLTGKARTASVKCIEDSVFLVLERQNFLSLSEKYPGLQETLTAALERRAQSAIETLLEIDSKGL